MPSRSSVEKYAKKKKRKHDTSLEDSSSDSDSESSGEVVSLSYRRSPTPRSPTPPLIVTKRKATSPPTVTDMVRRLEEELDSSNGESRHFNAELVRTSAQYERAQEHNTKTMAKVATQTGDLEEANLTIHGHTLRNIDLMSRLDALRHQVDVVAIDKEFLHASTQTDPLPSVVTSPSLDDGRKFPPPVDDAPDMSADSPSDDMDLSTSKVGKSAFRRQLKYKRKLDAASVTPSSAPSSVLLCTLFLVITRNVLFM